MFDILTAAQNGVTAVNNLTQLLSQATVNSSSLQVTIASTVFITANSTLFARSSAVTGSSGVLTFNGRSGTVVSASNDYVTNQIMGSTTNDSAPTGYIGEYVSATATSSTLTSASPWSVTSIALSAGDWDVRAQAQFSGGSGPTVTDVVTALSTTSNTISAGTLGVIAHSRLSVVDLFLSHTISPTRVSLASSATILGNVQVTYSGGTYAGSVTITARRMR